MSQLASSRWYTFTTGQQSERVRILLIRAVKMHLVIAKWSVGKCLQGRTKPRIAGFEVVNKLFFQWGKRSPNSKLVQRKCSRQCKGRQLNFRQCRPLNVYDSSPMLFTSYFLAIKVSYLDGDSSQRQMTSLMGHGSCSCHIQGILRTLHPCHSPLPSPGRVGPSRYRNLNYRYHRKLSSDTFPLFRHKEIFFCWFCNHHC